MKKIDWHAGFVSAMKLELMANEDSLEQEQIQNLRESLMGPLFWMKNIKCMQIV